MNPRDNGAPSSTALATRAETLEQGITRVIAGQFKAVKTVLPRHLTPERMCRVVVAAVTRNPELIKAAQQAPETLAVAVMEAATLGLEPVSILGHAYLIPRWNSKTHRVECSLQIGYRGFIELAGRSGRIATLTAELVYPSDIFEVAMGTDQTIRHVRDWRRPVTEEPYAVYAVALLKDGSRVFRVLTQADVEQHRASSDSYRAHRAGKLPAEACPWVAHKDEMWRKTAIRALAKQLPLSPELVQAAAVDEAREQGLDVGEIIDVPATVATAPEEAEAEPKATEEQLNQLRAILKDKDRLAQLPEPVRQAIDAAKELARSKVLTAGKAAGVLDAVAQATASTAVPESEPEARSPGEEG